MITGFRHVQDRRSAEQDLALPLIVISVVTKI